MVPRSDLSGYHYCRDEEASGGYRLVILSCWGCDELVEVFRCDTGAHIGQIGRCLSGSVQRSMESVTSTATQFADQ